MSEQRREQLAALCHSQWAGWMRYLFSKSITQADASTVIPEEFTIRWQRQMVTDYADLSEPEKESGRAEAEKFLRATDYIALQDENAALKTELHNLKVELAARDQAATQLQQRLREIEHGEGSW